MEMEKSLYEAEAIAKTLASTLRKSDAEMEVIKSKFRASTSKLVEE